MRVRVTIEYDYEDPEAFTPEDEAKLWESGSIDYLWLQRKRMKRSDEGSNLSVKAEKIAD